MVRAASTESVEDIEVAVAPGIELVGRVTNEAGGPVGGATIALRAQRPPLERFPLVRASPDGRFHLAGLFPGAFTLHAEADGFGSVELPLTLGAATSSLALKLPPATVISGTVVDSEGLPVEGALVKAGDWATTTSGAGGVFRITSVVPGEVTVAARHPERGVAVEEPRRLRAGEQVTVNLRLGAGAAVEGTVRDQSGAPAAGVKVVGGAGIGSYQTLSDENGRYRLGGLPAARFGVWALRKDRSLVSSSEKRPDQRDLMLRPGEVRTLDLVIGRGGQRISGVVVDPAGQPVGGANLSARAGRDGPGFNDSIGEVTTVSDEHGRFLFDDLVAGAFTLKAWHPRFGEIERPGVSTGPAEIRIAFAPSGAVVGTLRRPDGRPVADALVRVVAPTGPQRSALERSFPGLQKLPAIPVHDPGGMFAIEPIAPGRYRLEAAAVEGDQGAIEVNVEAGGRVEVSIVLEPGVRVAGRVVDDASGDALPGITVGVSDARGYHDVSTQPDGSFSLGGLAEEGPLYVGIHDRGNLHLSEWRALAPSAGAATVDAGVVRLRAGDPRKQRLGVSFTIENGRLRLLAVEEGSPAEQAGLRAKDVVLALNGHEAAALTTADFSYRLNTDAKTVLVVQAPGEAPRTVTLRRPTP